MCNDKVRSFLVKENKYHSGFKWNLVTNTDVLLVVKGLKKSKSKDIYDMNIDIVKSVLDDIIDVVTLCINQCLLDGVFPQSFKFAKIVPVLKKGNPSLVVNYRPVSILPIFSKILEKVIFKQLIEHFENNNIFDANQYGFRKGRNTVDAVETLVDQVMSGFDSRESSLAVLCDLTKAFDCVSHDVIVIKLKYYGIEENELKLIRSFLENRSQIVYWNGNYSDVSMIDKGVPQGSVLGPLLFLVMVNDLSSNMSCYTLLFADDTSLYASNDKIGDLKLFMSNSFNEAADWFQANGFKLNENKTQKILFTLTGDDGNGMEQPVNLLGVILDNRLSWRDHIESVCIRLSRVIYLLRSLKSIITKEFLRSAYHAFFESVLRYGIHIWGNGTGVDGVLLLQKKAVRILTGSSYDAHCRELFRKERLLTVTNLYILECLLKVKLNLDDYGIGSDHHSHLTRFNYQLVTPKVRLAKSKNWYSNIAIEMFNKLPREARDVNYNKFKLRINNWLCDNPFYCLKEFFKCQVNVKF